MITNPTLTMERERQRPSQSKRAALDPFETLARELPPLQQHDLLERQSFSVANAKNVTPIACHSRDTQLQVYAVPEDGMATIAASDVPSWAAGHSLAAQDYRPPASRSFGFTPYKPPVAICRASGDHEYQVLKGALTRLRSTLIRITVRYGAHWRRQQLSWINEWEELTTRSGRCQSIEFVVPASSYQGVLDPLLVPRSRGEKRQSGTAHRQGREP
jgi:plasmid replication initiation protein